MTVGPDNQRAGEAGAAMIEAIVSAVILLVAVLALFLELDVQTATSSNNRAASVAAGLAEADQERLRSFRVAQLSNRRETKTETVAGTPYEVTSRVDWIRDSAGGTQSCQAASSQAADYLRLTSTVTGRPGIAPVVLRSLVAPPVGQFGPGQGTVAVKVTGGAGQPVQGATVTVTGPATLSDTTNELGCAVFGFVPVGAYAVKASASAFVDPAGAALASGSVTASEGAVNLTTLQYDRAGSVAVSFDTKVAGAAVQPATASKLSVANAGVPGTGMRRFDGPLEQATIAATSLYPFTAAYTIFSGSCAAANPALYDVAGQPAYFDGNPGSVVVGPGSSRAITVREPALDLTLTAAPATSVSVRVKAIDAGCTDVYDWRITSSATGIVKLPEPGLPFGRYSVCADAGGRARTVPDVALRTPAGVSQAIDLRTAPTAPACA